ncbi:putative alkaloid synthase/Surface mucin Hemomucin [Handroanthus impetiginosus]|uniref:Putative alkaloid synthase/Surface mucin Hemomucin n=1 Tax=Handroanthus impetiginosus TaxID=429701 RepID=A0A2G9GX88_9LAMI|nr:putative alkaloid synthase/Surface mucin Hemomucin [Handroanthus impetiginosus]
MATLPIPLPILISIIPVIAAVVFYHLESFDTVPYPEHELKRKEPLFVPKRNSQMLRGSEKIGYGELPAPEDIAYDPKTGEIYTGCIDGWLSRVRVNGSAAEAVVEKWVNTGGRPLGIAHGVNGEVIVADAHKGLLNISRDGVIELLTDEAEGLKFKLTDAVDVGPDGILYFTDASYKYTYELSVLDLFEGRPNGRFLSYDPSTKETRVLVKDLYFANGVAVSPDQTFVIFCETPMRRCKRYYIQGPRRGSVDIFGENLPGLPDNIRYDGEGQYWIGLAMEPHTFEQLKRYPSIRKVIGMMMKYTGRPHIEKNGGVIAVDLNGKPTAYYHDPEIVFVSSGVKIGEHLYCGSLVRSYIVRLNLSQYPATPAE